MIEEVFSPYVTVTSSQLIIIPVVVALERMNYWSILCTLASILKREERVHELFVLPLSSPLPLIPFSSAPSFSPLSSSIYPPLLHLFLILLFCLHPSPLFLSLCISLHLLSSSSIRVASLPCTVSLMKVSVMQLKAGDWLGLAGCKVGKAKVAAAMHHRAPLQHSVADWWCSKIFEAVHISW